MRWGDDYFCRSQPIIMHRCSLWQRSMVEWCVDTLRQKWRLLLGLPLKELSTSAQIASPGGWRFGYPGRARLQPTAAIAQLGERQTEDLKIPGSIPGLGTFVRSPFSSSSPSVPEMGQHCQHNSPCVLPENLQGQFGELVLAQAV